MEWCQENTAHLPEGFLIPFIVVLAIPFESGWIHVASGTLSRIGVDVLQRFVCSMPSKSVIYSDLECTRLNCSVECRYLLFSSYSTATKLIPQQLKSVGMDTLLAL